MENRKEKKEEKAIVLIVDDVEANRFVLKEIVEEMGYLPMLTENGIQALKVVERFHPQFINESGGSYCRNI